MKKSLELKKINVTFLIFIFILCVSLIITSVNLIIQFRRYADSTTQSSNISRAALQLQEASDYLTEESRLFVITNNVEHMKNYFDEIKHQKRRETAISELKQSVTNTKALEYLELALQESHLLEQREYYAIKLILEGNHYFPGIDIEIPDVIKSIELFEEDAKLSDKYKISKAWIIVFSEDYMNQKQLISSYKSLAMTEILDYSDQLLYKSYSELKNNFYKMVFCIGFIFLFNFLLFIVIIGFVIIPLYNHIRSINSGKRLNKSHTKEFNILSDTFNRMYDKNEANEILLRHKAEHDELTGALNRVAFNQIKLAFADSSENLALILIDVDFFKQINDTYGHTTGDMVLKKVSTTLSKTFRTSDYVSRVGGDEFVVIMTKCDSNPEKTKQLISEKLSQIKEILSQPQDNIPPVTLSCGVSISNKGYSEHLYINADSALYEVKRAGRNNFSFYKN